MSSKAGTSKLFITPEELLVTIGGIDELDHAMEQASDALCLGYRQLGAFCRSTPNGRDLWKKYTDRRDSTDTPDDYSFLDFTREVLARAGHPVPV